MYHVTSNPHDDCLINPINTAPIWCHTSTMNINPTKTKEMLVRFPNISHFPAVTVDNEAIGQVTDCTLLDVVINENLNWQDNVDKVCKKGIIHCYTLFLIWRESKCQFQMLYH